MQQNRLLKSTKLSTIIIIPLIICIGSLLFILLFSFILGPPSLSNEKNTTFYSYDGQVIGYEQGLENRQWVSLDDVSDHFIQAIITAEDKHFFNHKGFDVKRMAQALWKNIRTWSLKEGASTLTQQYARNLYLSHEKTWWRKLKEAFYTIRLEMFYSKEEILEGYLNTIYFGHGTYGIETASHYFFNKQANQLTLAEATMLASIPRGPTYYSPLNNHKRAKQRQKHILHLLKNNDIISEKNYELARREHLSFAKQKPDPVQLGAYFHDLVQAEASRRLNVDESVIRSNGYHIYTTLGLSEQIQMEKIAEETIEQGSDIQVGALAVEQESGAIRALVGGKDYTDSPFNRVTMAKRMSGSAFKPLLYYAALEHHYTPSTRLKSQPTSFKVADEKVYAPKNYNGHYANAPITLAQAIALSDNIYAVKTHLYLGVETLPQYKEKFGMKSDLPAVPSLALGTATTTVYEMVTAFSRIANGGKEVVPYTIEKIVDPQGKTVYERRKNFKPRQILDPQKAFIMTQLLTGMFNKKYDSYLQVTGSSMIDQLYRANVE